MKKSIYFTLLLIAGIFTLASCQDSFPKGKDIKFKASSYSGPSTRTSYSGDIKNGRERIDWTSTDVIRVYSSSNAIVNGNGGQYYDYNLDNIATDNEKSTATLVASDASVRGLYWEDDAAAQAATLYAITPSTTPKNENNPLGGVFDNLVASAAPDITWTTDASGNTVGAPNMSQAFLISKPAKIGSDKKVALDFYPVYTAFDFTLTSKTETVTLNYLEITSTSDNLAGIFSYDASYLAEGQTPKNGFSQSTVEQADSQKKITVTFVGDTQISTTKSVKFTVFALPQDLTNISITVNFDNNQSRTLALKQNDSPIVFPAFHKANITGIALDAGDWNFVVETALNVMPWTVSGEHSIDISNTVVTTGFVFNSIHYANQYVIHDSEAWTNTFQAREEAALYIVFTISAPVGANWYVQASDPLGYFTVNKMVENMALDPTGTVDGSVITLRVKPNMANIPSQRTTDYIMELHTFVTVGDNAYNIDSETQNYDRYHHLAEFIIPANN